MVRFASYNIEHGCRGGRVCSLTDMVAQIRESQADVVGLQETRLADEAWQPTGPSIVATLVRQLGAGWSGADEAPSATSWSNGWLWRGAGGEGSMLPDGRLQYGTWRLRNVHLTDVPAPYLRWLNCPSAEYPEPVAEVGTELQRCEQLRWQPLREQLGDSNVVMGDLNEPIWYANHSQWSRVPWPVSWHLWETGWREHHQGKATWHDDQTGAAAQLDAIWLREGVVVKAVGWGSDQHYQLSDHRLVWVECVS